MRETFERIAVNLPPQASLQTLEALRHRGLIEYADDGRRRWWFVPTPIHAEWCLWCADPRRAGER